MRIRLVMLAVLCVAAQPPPKKGEAIDLSAVPFTGKEADLVRMKSEPREFIGRKFVICGRIKTRNYFNWGYSNSSDSHYSFEFRELKPGGRLVAGVEPDLYLSRRFGGPLNELAVQAESAGRGGLLVRLGCTIYANRLESDDRAPNNIEILDWQLYDRAANEWGPWASDVAQEKAAEARAAMKPKGDARAKPEPKQRKVLTDAERAENTYQAGYRLERQGYVNQAVNVYKGIAKDFPNEPAAKKAKDRIKALSK